MLYLIKQFGDGVSWLKIGFSEKLDDRLKAYNTHNAYYELIDTIDSGSKKDETVLHNVLNPVQYKNEWFYEVKEVYSIWNAYKNLLEHSCENLQQYYLSESIQNYGEFMQVWLKDNQEFWDLTKSEYAVMVQCWRASVYYPELVDENLPGNKVTTDKQFKDIAAKNANITVRSVDSALSSLAKKNLLIKDKNYKGIYYLNPKLFFKGKISDRTKIIKHSIEYQIATK